VDEDRRGVIRIIILRVFIALDAYAARLRRGHGFDSVSAVYGGILTGEGGKGSL